MQKLPTPTKLRPYGTLQVVLLFLLWFKKFTIVMELDGTCALEVLVVYVCCAGANTMMATAMKT